MLFRSNSGTVKYRKGTFTILTGIEEETGNLFSVSPNPIDNGTLTIRYLNAKDTPIQCTITNVLGQELIHQVAAFQNSLMQVDVSSLTAGTYFLKIVTDSEQFVSKVIKQ